jgi:hypothetical protein
LAAPTSRLAHLGKDLFEQSGDDLELMPTDPIVGPVGSATVFVHLEERIRPFRPDPAPVEADLPPRWIHPRLELWDAVARG